MRCINPTLVFDGKSGRIFRSFDLVNKELLPFAKLVLNCGKCLICRKKKAYELACRCELHASLYKQNCFITLTYDEKQESYHNNFHYPDIQKFKKDLRSYVKHHYEKRIEIFNVHEYGKNGKKHWHLIVFNHDFEDKTLHTINNQIPIYTSKRLEKIWKHGFNTIGNVTLASAMYQAQYMEKDFKNGYVTTNKKSHSKHSGIGRPYFLIHFKQILTLGYIPINGRKLPVPRYFEKLAHKHYSHFYDLSNFNDYPHRKALYRPFKEEKEKPNLELANLYVVYKKSKQTKILDLEKEWDDVILQYLTTDKTPDFITSGLNKLYDLKNKQQKENF